MMECISGNNSYYREYSVVLRSFGLLTNWWILAVKRNDNHWGSPSCRCFIFLASRLPLVGLLEDTISDNILLSSKSATTSPIIPLEYNVWNGSSNPGNLTRASNI
ncbi:uncharacterized protein [Rhodnius prolixus]|uniref:uncharacterized protein n=1 Tax=Rhodnius prolixus TaxID=13249 RepID=UPI003D18AAF4